jgi:hypothetical protein
VNTRRIRKFMADYNDLPIYALIAIGLFTDSLAPLITALVFVLMDRLRGGGVVLVRTKGGAS